MIQKSHFWVCIQKDWKSGSWRDICTPIFISSTIQNSQEVEPIQTSMDGWVDKTKWGADNGILFSKEKNSVTCYNRGKPWYVCVCVYLVAQSCLTLCDPKDYSPPGSSVHGILQTRILEWVAISFSRGSSQPRNWTRVQSASHTDSLPLSHLGSSNSLR